jgi:hypothetical protein
VPRLTEPCQTGPGTTDPELRFWKRTCAAFAALAVLKTVHAPNGWAYAQSLLTYGSGATRRALFGTVLAMLHVHTYLQFSTVSAWILVGLFAATVLLARQAGVFRNASAVRLAAVFALSYSLSYSVDLVGYLDNVLLLLTVLTLLLRNRPGLYLAAAMLTAAAGVLIHENSIFFVVPLLAAAPIARMISTSNEKGRRLAITTSAAVVLAAAIPLAWLLLRPAPSFAQAAELGARIQATTSTPLRMDFFYIQAATAPRLMRLMLNYYRNPDYWIAQLQAAIAFLPAAFLFLYYSLRTLPNRWWPRWLCVAASLSPLAMHLLGWDLYRWDALAVWTSFLVFVLLTPNMPTLRLSSRAKQAALALMVLNAAAGPGLIDANPIHAFPDVHQVPVLVRLLTGRPQHAASTRPVTSVTPEANNSLTHFGQQ